MIAHCVSYHLHWWHTSPLPFHGLEFAEKEFLSISRIAVRRSLHNSSSSLIIARKKIRITTLVTLLRGVDYVSIRKKLARAQETSPLAIQSIKHRLCNFACFLRNLVKHFRSEGATPLLLFEQFSEGCYM